jgi:hypothetical protein
MTIPIMVSNETILKAIAVLDGYADSPVVSRSYIEDSAMAKLSRGHYLLIEKGLQIQALVYPRLEDNFAEVGLNLTQFAESNFTTVNFARNADVDLYLGDAVTSPCWSRWAGLTVLGDNEIPYLDKMISVQYGDEWDVTVSEPQQIFSNWLSNMHNLYPDVILFTNQYGNQLSFEDLQTYMQATGPDLVCFDTYTFDGNLSGGSPTRLYNDMQKYRRLGLAGNDGTGAKPIPYALYTQTYINNNHTLSESEMYLNEFAAWAFGYKFITVYTYDAPASAYAGSSILFSGVGDGTPITEKLNQIAEVNRQSLNLGSTLVRLLSTNVRMIMGKHGSSGTMNTTPDNVTAVISGADAYMTDAVVTAHPSDVNDDQPGDVIVVFFKVLDESFDGVYTDQQYFMVVNGLSDGTATSSETQQTIKLTFNMGSSGIKSLKRLSRDTGQVETVALTSKGNGIYELDLTLEGGIGDLFMYNTGAPFVGIEEANPTPGDANLDGAVNVTDLSVLAAYYNTTSGATWAMGDSDSDKDVDVTDLSILAANYNSGSTSTMSWADAYAKVFGTTSDVDEASDASTDDIGRNRLDGISKMNLYRSEQSNLHSRLGRTSPSLSICIPGLGMGLVAKLNEPVVRDSMDAGLRQLE